MCRAHFAAGQLVSQLSSGFKGQALVDGVLEAVRYIMLGVELAAANPRCAQWDYQPASKHSGNAGTAHMYIEYDFLQRLFLQDPSIKLSEARCCTTAVPNVVMQACCCS